MKSSAMLITWMSRENNILLITRKKIGSLFLTFGLMLEYMTNFIVQCSLIASVHKSSSSASETNYSHITVIHTLTNRAFNAFIY